MKLPQTVQDVADVIGRDKALYLVGNLPRSRGAGGTGGHVERIFLYVPKRLKPDHLLVRLLGWNDAAKMSAEFTGMILELGTCDELQRRFRHDAVRRLAAQGHDRDAIAGMVMLSPRRVSEILASAPEASAAANDNHAPIIKRAGANDTRRSGGT